MNKSLKILTFTLLLLFMLGTTVWASLQQNLFTEFSWSGSPMWFQATIIDFYINQFIFWLWVVYLEPGWIARMFWLVFFFCFGSMGTCLFIIIKLFRNQSLFERRQV